MEWLRGQTSQLCGFPHLPSRDRPTGPQTMAAIVHITRRLPSQGRPLMWAEDDSALDNSPLDESPL